MQGEVNGRERRPGFGKVLLWALLIFVTSCFFINAETFIHFVERFDSSPAFRAWFERFWNNDSVFVVKGWHATEYAILLTLGATALYRRFSWRRSAAVWTAFALAVLFAASDEWHQTFVPGRDGCVRDVLIDTAGALLAAGILLWRWRRQDKRRAFANPPAG